MGFLLDTSVIVQIERRRSTLEKFLGDPDLKNLGISTITVAELLHGVHLSDNPAFKSKRSIFVEEIFQKVPIYPFDLEASKIYAEIWSNLRRQGINIGTHDLLIGATALSLGFSVVTLNQKDFSRIPNLKVKTV